MVREVDYDIVVIGCGVAGTAAALSAAKRPKGKETFENCYFKHSDFDHKRRELQMDRLLYAHEEY